MNKDPQYVTFIFSNVPDTSKFLATFKQHIPFPIVDSKEQNDGVVALVLKDVAQANIEQFMTEFCNRFGYNDVLTAAAIGNVFG